jgi:signal transduction histidine kinase
VASLSRTACSLLDEAREQLPQDIHADLTPRWTPSPACRQPGGFRQQLPQPVHRAAAQPQRVLLEALFERLKALEPQWQDRLTFSVEPASLEVMIDPGQLEQALINLLKNAAEAGTEAPSARA